jgi:hypothetical protein
MQALQTSTQKVLTMPLPSGEPPEIAAASTQTKTLQLSQAENLLRQPLRAIEECSWQNYNGEYQEAHSRCSRCSLGSGHLGRQKSSRPDPTYTCLRCSERTASHGAKQEPGHGSKASMAKQERRLCQLSSSPKILYQSLSQLLGQLPQQGFWRKLSCIRSEKKGRR